MRFVTLTLFLALGCNGEAGDEDTSDDDTSGDVDTSDDSDTSDDADTDTDADTEPDVACVFSDLSTRALSNSGPQPFVQFSYETTLDACFGDTLEGRLVREAYNGDGTLCRIVLPFTATVSVADADLCADCDDGFDEITWGTPVTTGMSCGDLRMNSEPPFFCAGQTPTQVYAIATDIDGLYRSNAADTYGWAPWVSGDAAVRGDDPAAGVSAVSTSQGTFDPEAMQFGPCESQAGASR